jgi:hypothetical protein
MEVTTSNRSSFTWFRSVPDRAAGAAVWQAALTADHTFRAIAQSRRV